MLFRGSNPDPHDQRQQDPTRPRTAIRRTGWTRPWGLEGGAIDLRIVLDTTGGTGAWTATWYAKLPADGSYSLVGATTTIPHAASNYTSVGIAASNTNSTTGTGGTIESFSLTSSTVSTPPTIIAKTPDAHRASIPAPTWSRPSARISC
jgi:hypothetical protein